MNVAVPSGATGVASSASTDIFASEAAIIKALSVVRQAAIPSEAKDSLRDMFLRYVGESDETERAELKKSITTELDKYPQLSVLKNTGGNSAAATVTSENKPEENKTSSLGHTRPVPTFFAGAAATPTAPKEPPQAPTPAPRTTPSNVPEKPIEPEVPAEPKTVPVPPEPSVQPPASEPVAAPTPQPPPPTTEPTPAPATSNPNFRARIDEIKHDINSRIGNPVNLINADEKVGREYMSSLLEAMRAASKGGGAEVLERLEKAYQAADQLIKSQGLSETGPAAADKPVVETPTLKPVTPTPPAEPAPAEQVPPDEPIAPPAPPPPPPTPTPEPVKETPEPVLTQSEGLYHRPSDETEAASDKEKQKSPALGLSSLAGKLFKSEDDTDTSSQTPAAASITPSQANVRKVSVNNQTAPPPTPPPTNHESEKLQPLQMTATALPEKMAALKAEANKREQEAKKPITDLNSPEIDAGLRQLLAEWSLFKKSGFLGTGPSGIDHPLYKKLAPLPMAAVVSGRFEGSTPEIKQKLSAYMTGWRYEQGILHEMGESFEHYLRRVIRKIIERQRTVVNS